MDEPKTEKKKSLKNWLEEFNCGVTVTYVPGEYPWQVRFASAPVVKFITDDPIRFFEENFEELQDAFQL